MKLEDNVPMLQITSCNLHLFYNCIVQPEYETKSSMVDTIIFPISIALSLIADDSAAALADGRSRATCLNGLAWQNGMMTSIAIKQHRMNIFILICFLLKN
ncbi:hypothetical protein T01_9715 [Trichinella spiralis]|uniref:Uncharacterized protein n=1 Tax=Trichinella spiralis TaxID=6334 RepID=A0A0V1BQL3_TRISP|nr:hypothetical protein T01_9715 [Trichinella spiralis]